jgi:diguanylate cyclase (GGDEF)-like protein
MKTVLKYMDTIPKKTTSAFSFILVIFLGFIDYISGYEISFSIFYLLPVLTATWFITRRYGVVISVFSAIMWYLADIASGHTYLHYIIPVWNSLMRFGFFLIVTFSLAEVRNLLDKEKSMARKDFLTGVANSRSFYEIATKEIERTARFIHPLSLAYIDIDNFKQVNDTLGHSAGDKLLHSVADNIKENIRSIDTVSRLGGDEFAILMPETNAENAMTALNKLRHNLMDMVQENNWPVTFSIGVVTCSESCKLDELIKEADNLMYTVKDSGKNRIENKVHSFNNTNA